MRVSLNPAGPGSGLLECWGHLLFHPPQHRHFNGYVTLFHFSKSSMKQMWNLLNMMQLITYISLLSVPVPPNVVMVVEYFRFSRGEIPFVQNLIQTQVLAGSDLHDGGINEAFAQEYDSTSVIYNSGGVIFMWSAVWSGLGVLLLLMRCLGRRV